MTILHIANSYGGTAVYTNLYTAIDTSADITQWVYVPLNSRNHDRLGNKIIDFKNVDSRIHYSTILKPYHRYLYGLKIRAIFKDIESIFDLRKVDFIHAGTLCLDGAVAYEISKKYGIPYISTIRNTDVNAYYKRLVWRKYYFTKVLEKAYKIIFISPKYKEKFVDDHVPLRLQKEIASKMIVIPNGVNSLFLTNRNKCVNDVKETFRIIFVAAFYRGKGLVETIKAIELLRSKGFKVSLNAIGKGLPNRPKDNDYIEMVEEMAKGKEWIKIQPFKQPEEIIMEMRMANAFIMVSKPETFGLVYVEALSQGLPIIYAQGQGFDGFFPDGYVGYSAIAGDVVCIAEKIENLINNYHIIVKNVESLDLYKDFEWNNIAKKYIHIYNTVI